MNLRLAAESKFEGCEKDELVVYCQVLGIEVKDGHSKPQLRKLLLDTLGQYNELNIADPADQVADAQRLEDMNLAQLNLASNGIWQGKRRVVTLHRAAHHDTSYPLFLGWENLHVYLPYGIKASLPWPIWKILEQTTDAMKMISKRHIDDEGRVSYRQHWVPDQPYMFTDHNDDPDTQNLPGTIIEAMRMVYHASGGLEKYEPRQLREMCRRLRIPIRPDWEIDRLIQMIQATLSIPVAMDLAGSDITAAGVASA
jgi:hypothetical protein